MRAHSVTRHQHSQEPRAGHYKSTQLLRGPQVHQQRFVTYNAEEMRPPDATGKQGGFLRIPTPQARTSRNLGPRRKLRGTPPFATTQFHVLFNSLFKVLFNFPSRYLFAIGLGVIFSLTRSLPRTLSCTPKQLDSKEKAVKDASTPPRAYHPLWAVAPVRVDLDGSRPPGCCHLNTTFHTT